MRTLGLDVETSKKPRHMPYSEGSFLVSATLVDPSGWLKTYIFNHTEVEDLNQRYCIEQIQEQINKSTRIVGHGLKFDLIWMTHLGIDYSHCELFDTMVADYLINGQKKQGYNLDEVSRRWGITPKIDQVKVFWDSDYETDEIPLDILVPYQEQDAINTLVLHQKMAPVIRENGLEKLVALQMAVLGILTGMEYAGMAVSCERMEGHISDLIKQQASIEGALKEAIGWNVLLSSGDELSAALYGGIVKRDKPEVYVTTRNCTIKEPYTFQYKSGRTATKYRNRTVQELVCKTRKVTKEYKVKGVGFVPIKGSQLKKEGYYATDKNTLGQLAAGNKKLKLIKKLLLEYSVVKKAVESFLGANKDDAGLANKIQADGCLHPKFNQAVTATGRLSSSDPNGQNFPRKGTSPIKLIFIPRAPGRVIVNADLSQLEWRVAAFLSQDPVAINEILHDLDYHRDNAIRFFQANPDLDNDHPDFKPKRTTAKVFGFRLLYGGSAYGMWIDQNMPDYSKKRWEEIVTEYYEKYSATKAWQNRNIDLVYQNQGWLKTPSGRILTFPELAPNYKGELYSSTQIKNYPVQSLSFDVVAMAMIQIKRKMIAAGLDALMICQVHDSIVFDCPESEVHTLSRICVETFEDLPRLLSLYWGVDWNIPLTGDVEAGPSYGEVKKVFWEEAA